MFDDDDVDTPDVDGDVDERDHEDGRVCDDDDDDDDELF